MAQGCKLKMKDADKSIRKGMFRSIMTKKCHKVINPNCQGEISGLTDSEPEAMIIRNYFNYLICSQ